MTIEFTHGDIFESRAQALVNPVNCVGVMGKGLAKQFKQKYPKNFKRYKEACESGQLNIGCPLFTYEDEKYIINFPTKIHWKAPSRYRYVFMGIERLPDLCRAQSIGTVAIPRLGCGLGGLNWARVRNVIEGYFEDEEDFHAIVYE